MTHILPDCSECSGLNAHAETCSQAPKRRVSWLSVPEMFSLNVATAAIVRAFGWRVFLVGSALERRDYRDVDVRCILPDEEFAKLCAEPDAWNDERLALLNAALSEWLSSRTGLPIDFQFQPRTEANEKFPGRRISLGVYIMPEAEAGHGGERADTGAPGALTPARLDALERAHLQINSKHVMAMIPDGALRHHVEGIINALPALLAAARERETLKQAVVDAERSEKNEHDLRMRWQRMKDELLTEGVALRTRVSALEEAAGPFANLDCVTWCHAIRGEEHDCDVAKLRALLTSTPDVAPKPADDGGRT